MRVLVVSRSLQERPPANSSEDSKTVYPGTPMIGEGYDVIVLRTKPRNAVEREWFDNLITRLYRDGVIV